MCDVHSAQLFASVGVNFDVVLLSKVCRQAELYQTKAWMLAFLTIVLEPFYCRVSSTGKCLPAQQRSVLLQNSCPDTCPAVAGEGLQNCFPGLIPCSVCVP